MQCGCMECGYLMGQVVKGLDSYCQCPACEQKCWACLGSKEGNIEFITKESLLQKKSDMKINHILDRNFGKEKV